MRPWHEVCCRWIYLSMCTRWRLCEWRKHTNLLGNVRPVKFMAGRINSGWFLRPAYFFHRRRVATHTRRHLLTRGRVIFTLIVSMPQQWIYRQTSNIRRTLVGNKLVGHSDVVGAACSNYIFILDLTPGFNGLGKKHCKTRRESFKFRGMVRLKLEILRYINLTFYVPVLKWNKPIVVDNVFIQQLHCECVNVSMTKRQIISLLAKLMEKQFPVSWFAGTSHEITVK